MSSWRCSDLLFGSIHTVATLTIHINDIWKILGSGRSVYHIKTSIYWKRSHSGIQNVFVKFHTLDWFLNKLFGTWLTLLFCAFITKSDSSAVESSTRNPWIGGSNPGGNYTYVLVSRRMNHFPSFCTLRRSCCWIKHKKSHYITISQTKFSDLIPWSKLWCEFGIGPYCSHRRILSMETHVGSME